MGLLESLLNDFLLGGENRLAALHLGGGSHAVLPLSGGLPTLGHDLLAGGLSVRLGLGGDVRRLGAGLGQNGVDLPGVYHAVLRKEGKVGAHILCRVVALLVVAYVDDRDRVTLSGKKLRDAHAHFAAADDANAPVVHFKIVCLSLIIVT